MNKRRIPNAGYVHVLVDPVFHKNFLEACRADYSKKLGYPIKSTRELTSMLVNKKMVNLRIPQLK